AADGAAAHRKDECVMADIKHGTVTITIPDDLAPPREAGRLTRAEVARIPRAPHGVGLACEQAADAMEKAGDAFVAPVGVTPVLLRVAGHNAEAYDQVLVDVDVVRATLCQASLLMHQRAWEFVRKVNDQVKAQGKHAPELLAMFQQLRE